MRSSANSRASPKAVRNRSLVRWALVLACSALISARLRRPGIRPTSSSKRPANSFLVFSSSELIFRSPRIGVSLPRTTLVAPGNASQGAVPTYDGWIAGTRELVEPSPTLGNLKEIAPPVLLAMLFATGIVVLDGLSGPSMILISLLAIPPVIAAMSASVPETGIVAAFCALMALLSGLWNQDLDQAQYFVRLFTVVAGGLAGLWVASLRENLNREQQAAELFVELGARMEDALDQSERAGHLADIAVPILGDVAMVDMLTPDGQIVRTASRSHGTDVASRFDRMRKKTPIDPDGAHPVAVAIRTGQPQDLGPLSDDEVNKIAPREKENELLRSN